MMPNINACIHRHLGFIDRELARTFRQILRVKRGKKAGARQRMNELRTDIEVLLANQVNAQTLLTSGPGLTSRRGLIFKTGTDL